jgi:hypothetical protein
LPSDELSLSGLLLEGIVILHRLLP